MAIPARRLPQSVGWGINLKISIIGFTLGARERAAIECVVKQTGGRY